jgi:hypothetical protein
LATMQYMRHRVQAPITIGDLPPGLPPPLELRPSDDMQERKGVAAMHADVPATWRRRSPRPYQHGCLQQCAQLRPWTPPWRCEREELGRPKAGPGRADGGADWIERIGEQPGGRGKEKGLVIY